MRTFNRRDKLLAKMYRDEYYPNHLVDKVRDLIEDVVDFLEAGDTYLDKIQDKFDTMTEAINDLQEEFEAADSGLETVARESIGETVELILDWFGIDLDVEEAIRNREW